MKIIAVSDIHGNLITIKEQCDILVIAGDWSPLYIQHDCLAVLEWIDKRFIPWAKSLNTSHIIFIPGNHDLACTYSFFKDDLFKIVKRHQIQNKLHYLCNSSIIIDSKKFYGNPNSESPKGWAFSRQYNVDYEFDEDTDVLITHQPPRFGDIGYVKQTNREFGSVDLRNKILESNIELNICGHIHTGEHGCHPILLNNNKKAYVYNVSILNEDYIVAYKPTIIEI